MVSISKHDKKLWENYLSNFEKFVIIPQRNTSVNSNHNPKKILGYKNEKSISSSKIFTKKRFKPDRVLDLHGYSLYSAKMVLSKYIINCYEKSIRNILIITGKGQFNKGLLKQEVPKWLNDYNLKKLIISFDIAPKNFGGEGALLIKIRNRYKK